MSYDTEALAYHRLPRPGKLEIRATKPTATQHDLALAYTPGVAVPCLEIEKDPDTAYDYTNKGNLVAVVSNGSAVLGLGNIGALAGKPVMEGKAVLFKRFAFVDVFDLELDVDSAEGFVAAVKSLEPTFGGINIEDVKAPECFYIEETLEREMDIPVFHDDQHGTAIISAAAFLNALEITGRDIAETRVVVSGAGAAGIACTTMLVALGVRRENLLMCDSRGVIYEGRGAGMNPYKERFAAKTDARSLADAMRDADAFLGVSVKGALTQDMVRTMAKDPIVFAMANPDPEITYPEARAARPDAIIATGRSDFPNQVNNVLGFPFIFRGALDTRSRYINMEMKLAGVHALANLAKKEVPESVSRAYAGRTFQFGRDYLIPKPFDPRVLYHMSTAIAEAAMRSGAAREEVDIEAYRERLKQLVDPTRVFVSVAEQRAREARRRIVYPEATEPKVLRAVAAVVRDGTATPVLVGPAAEVRAKAEAAGVRLDGVEIVDPDHDPAARELRRFLHERGEAVSLDGEEPLDPFLASLALVQVGRADGLVGGLGREYGSAIRPALRLVGRAQGVRRATGVHVLFLPKKTLFFADTTLNVEPTADDLCEIAIHTSRFVRRFNVEPVIGLVSFGNLGENPHPACSKVAHAVAKIRGRMPSLKVAGELQADVALDPASFSFIPKARHHGPANVLIFPNLDASNAAFRLCRALTGGQVLGPFLVGLQNPVHIVPRGSTAEDLIGMTSITAAFARSAASVE